MSLSFSLSWESQSMLFKSLLRASLLRFFVLRLYRLCFFGRWREVFLGKITKDGRWSDIPTLRFPLIASGLIMLVKILSISDLVELVILVGRDIVGKRKLLVIISKKLDTSSSELIFKRFKLRSPAIKMFFYFLI